MYIVNMVPRIDKATLPQLILITRLFDSTRMLRTLENVKNPGKCHVRMLGKYLSLIPQEAYEKDNFYLTPLPTKPEDPLKPWFTSTPTGRNQLGALMKEMCQEAGIVGNIATIVLELVELPPCFKLECQKSLYSNEPVTDQLKACAVMSVHQKLSRLIYLML